MALQMLELVGALAAHPDRWEETSIRGEHEPVPWFPVVRVNSIGSTSIGVDGAGRWILGRSHSDGVRDLDGLVFDPASSKGFLYLLPMLDWLPRTVMNDARVIAEIVGLRPEAVWDVVPWRYVISSAFEGGRMQYVRSAVDWIWYLDVVDDFREQLAALLDHPRVRGEENRRWIEMVLAKAPLTWSPGSCF